MQKKRRNKYKHILWFPALIVAAFFIAFFYYRFDPEMLKQLSFYASLANPYIRIIRVEEGLRKEEVAEVIAEKLNWGTEDKEEFIQSAEVEGHYFPKTYLIYKDEAPKNVSAIMESEFQTQLAKVKKPKTAQVLKEETIVKIASIIQREAAGKNDMALISGIIWNRMFKGMKLQVDATLQYAKGNEEDGWWGEVEPEDKKIKSSYNTYLYEGLPPGAIANPGLNAIAAAYNPQKTKCLFYLHDKRRRIHCAETYEKHRRNIETYLK